MRNVLTFVLCAIIVGFILVSAKTPPQPEFTITAGGHEITVSGKTLTTSYGYVNEYETVEELYTGLADITNVLHYENISEELANVLHNYTYVIQYEDGETRLLQYDPYMGEEYYVILEDKDCDDHGTCVLLNQHIE